MKIGYVAPRYRPLVGGVETHVEKLAIHAARRGHEVDVLTQGPGLAVEAFDGVTVRRFRVTTPGAHFAAAPGLWRYLRRAGRDYDVLHAHNYHALPALAAAMCDHRCLLVTPHYHGTSASPFRRALHLPYRRAGAFMLRRARRIVCVTRQEAMRLSSHFPDVEGRIVVIPNGVDGASLGAAEPYPDERITIFSAGRLEGYKRVERVIEALPHLDSRFVLRIAGEGPARRRLERRIADLGLGGRVELLGRVETAELHRWFRTAAVYISLSELEASGISALEARAAGARVVASDIPAHRETAELAGAGVFLLSSPDARELARAIEGASQAEARPAELASWEEVTDKTLAEYESQRSRTLLGQ